MSFTNFLENKVLGHVFGGVSYTAPTTIYIALFTAAPSDTGGGTEVTGGSYARVAVTASTGMTVTGTSPTQVANVNSIDFPTATGSWGTVTHSAVFDASSGGNMLDWSALTASKTVATGDAIRFPAGEFKITLD